MEGNRIAGPYETVRKISSPFIFYNSCHSIMYDRPLPGAGLLPIRSSAGRPV